MIRIKYRKGRPEEGENKIVSEFLLFAKATPVVVEIDTKNNTFILLNYTNRAIILEGSAKSLSNVKRKAKNAVKKLGVKFHDELRTNKKRKKLRLVVNND